MIPWFYLNGTCMVTRWLVFLGNETSKKYCAKLAGRRYQHVNVCMFTKCWDYFQPVSVVHIKMVGKAPIQRKGRCLQEDVDLKDPTPIMNQVYLGCTQTSAQADTKKVKSEAELYTRLTTTRDGSDKDQTTAIPSSKVSS